MSAVKNIKQQVSNLSKAQPEPNRRILIVDDEPAIAEGIKSILCPDAENVIPFRRSSRSAASAAPDSTNPMPVPAGFEVVVVNSPHAALHAVKEAYAEGNPFAMGFFDVLLGADIDGIELVKKVHEIDGRMFAVFVTAYHDRNVNSINDFLGHDKSDRWDYINKPFTDGEILQKARNVTSLWNLQRMQEWHEEQLSEAQKLLLQNERMNTVAAVGRSVAHEFGNLMMQIVGHAELAILKNDQVRMKEALETILKASDTATNILGRFKKLASGHDKRPEKNLIHLFKPVEEAIDLMGYQFKKSQITIEKPKWEQILIEGNHHSIVQVLMNLFINAAHVMPNGGKIEVSIVKNGNDEAIIKVRDHGPGIPADILPKVTEPLFTTKGSQGTGLGLAICKEIIEIEHRGEMTLDNHPQGGVEISIKLPTRQEGSDDDET